MVNWEHIADTRDTGDPVLKATTGESYANIIFDTENRELRVAHVASREKGDMKAIIDNAVRKTGWHTVVFLTPLDDLNPPGATRLIGRLDGFSEETESHTDQSGDEIEITVYRGTWEPS